MIFFTQLCVFGSQTCHQMAAQKIVAVKIANRDSAWALTILALPISRRLRRVSTSRWLVIILCVARMCGCVISHIPDS